MKLINFSFKSFHFFGYSLLIIHWPRFGISLFNAFLNVLLYLVKPGKSTIEVSKCDRSRVDVKSYVDQFYLDTLFCSFV